jgi:hypothetical protein
MYSRSIMSLLAVACLCSAQTDDKNLTLSPATPPVQGSTTKEAPTEQTPPRERLLKVRRIFVDSFGDDLVSKQVQAMVISSLTESEKFVVTENKEKADAILKGSGLEKTSQEIHSSSDATAAGGAAGGHSGSISGGPWGVSGSSSGGFVSRSAAIEDSVTTTETINDARVAVRLVDKEGDVIWATTQESKGAKYKGASADVADKIVKQLLHDAKKSEKPSTVMATPTKEN